MALLNLNDKDAGLDCRNRINAAIDKLNQADDLQFNTAYATPAHSEGLIFYDQTNKTFAYFNDEADVTMQMGQELWIRVYNDTVGTINNGDVCYLSGVNGGFPTIAKAQADAPATCLTTLGIATHSIETMTYGYITVSGVVRDLNTNSYTAGDILYLSPTVAGGMQNTRPVSPDFDVTIGVVGVKDAAAGTLHANIHNAGRMQETEKFYNGGILEDHSLTVTSTGAVVSANLEKSGGGDLSLIFDGTFTNFVATPSAATVALTAGTDISPTLNYVYIPESTGLLTASTVSFPTTGQFVPVATVLCQSAASVLTYGAYKVHAWTDHLANDQDQGHLSHLNEWIRNQNATWLAGNLLTPTITTNVGTPDNFDIATASGTILQLHKHTMPARNTGTGDSVYVVNDSATAYNRVTDLNTLLTDASGNSMSAKYFNLVIWGVISEAATDCKLYVNLPTGSYNTQALALADASKYTVYSIPADFKGTGFLIAELTVRHQTASGGTWTLVRNNDLRGQVPNVIAGSAGAATVTTFPDNAFRIYDSTDVTKEIAFEASGITTGTTRTLTSPDSDGTIALTGIDNAFSSNQTINTNSTTALLVEQNGVKDDVLIADTTNGRVGMGGTPTTRLDIHCTAENARIFGTGDASQGLFHIRSTQTNKVYMSMTEDNVADLGAIGFEAGDTVMNFRLGTVTDDVKFSIDSNNVNIPTGSTYNINGADINTAGTLTNVAYENQANTFTANQKLDDSGNNTNSYKLILEANNGGTIQTSSIQGIYGADPYLRISVPNGAGAETAVLDINDTTFTFANDNTVDIGASGANRPKNIYAAGNGSFVGDVSAANFDAANSFKVGGTDINTGGTLSNVGYLDQGQTFTGAQKIDVASTTAFFVEDDSTKDNVFIVDTTNGRVGVNAAPSQALDVVGAVELEDTTTSTTGVIYKGSSSFIHNFHHPNGDSAVPDGYNIFAGVGTGNFSMGSGATSVSHASYNSVFGSAAFSANTLGRRNSVLGYNALNSNTIGENNSAMGFGTLAANTSGDNNSGFGYGTLFNATTADENTAGGYASLFSITSGGNNTALGGYSGRYISGGAVANTTSSNSVYLGHSTKASADGNSNEIVIGYDCTGNGSNTATLGNSSITDTYIIGDLHLADIKSGATQVAAGAAANELWKTALHATLPDNVVMIGV